LKSSISQISGRKRDYPKVYARADGWLRPPNFKHIFSGGGSADGLSLLTRTAIPRDLFETGFLNT